MQILSGIYLHIPFCKQACSYCDFYFSTSLANKDVVIKSMVKEIEESQNYLPEKNIKSIYFGGGSPSLLSNVDLSLLFKSLSNYYTWDLETEITLEANPDDVTTEKLKVWKEAGINRLSIGLQSFNNEELKWMNRAHSAEESLRSVKLAQEMGFHNITIDLIYGSKFQTLKSWDETLEIAIGLGTQHISAYNLTIEAKTVLGSGYYKGSEPSVDEELSKELFDLMVNRLTEAGFVHYEISNFGKPGFLAKHNSNYWLQEAYLGLGPSAHSYNYESRQWNLRNNNLYVKALEQGDVYFEREELALRDRYNEYVLTRLRTLWGCDLLEIEKKFGPELSDHFRARAHSQKKLLDEKDGIYTLNHAGKFLADGIASNFFFL
ncbi:MAG: radical SAM family heme chaperone HemW [bacterium]|nr:radical SAM family heme chaperone HemW [bacterium]